MILTIYENKKRYNPEYRGVYSITFDNGKRYIGISNCVCERLWEHLKDVKAGDTLPVHLAMKKHKYVFELLEECSTETRKELCEKEKYWIAYYNTFLDKNKGYNLTPGGDGASEGIYNSSAKLSQEQINQIYDLLQNHLELYIYEIAEKFNVSAEAISSINNGKRYYNSNLSYPLRKPPKPNVGIGVNNHLAFFQSDKEFNMIINDLQDSKLTLTQIAEKYLISYTTVSNINRGIRYHNDKIDYPIRKRSKKFLLSVKQEQEIIEQLINSSISMTQLAINYNVSKDTIYRINKGNRKINNNYVYPLRANKKINKAVSTIPESGEQGCY